MASLRRPAFLRVAAAALGWRLEKRTRGIRARTRLATARLRLRPTFLVIGAQKAGTTSLHHYLGEHPAVILATDKEMHYFGLKHPMGERWYLSHFPLRSRKTLVRLQGTDPAVGEATPAYLFDPAAPARVHAFDEGMRLIAILRNPIDRAYAHYQWERSTRDETRSFEDALTWEEEVLAPELELWFADPLRSSSLPLFGRSYVARGRYAEQLERWLALFPRDQLLVLTTDELKADPAGTMVCVERFLGIPRWTAASYPHENVGSYPPMSPESREHLARIFQPHNERLEELLGRELPWTHPARMPR